MYRYLFKTFSFFFVYSCLGSVAGFIFKMPERPGGPCGIARGKPEDQLWLNIIKIRPLFCLRARSSKPKKKKWCYPKSLKNIKRSSKIIEKSFKIIKIIEKQFKNIKNNLLIKVKLTVLYYFICKIINNTCFNYYF